MDHPSTQKNPLLNSASYFNKKKQKTASVLFEKPHKHLHFSNQQILDKLELLDSKTAEVMKCSL